MTNSDTQIPPEAVRSVVAPIRDDDAVVPFVLDVPQDRLDDLAARVRAARLPFEVPGRGWARGIPGERVRELLERWAGGYDWRAAEARLNAVPQFTTTIDGAGIHFLHVRSPEADAVPLLLLHGWPSSVLEFLDLIGPPTDPRAHGHDPSVAFDVVIPSIPNYPLSGPTPDDGWTGRRTAEAFATLMDRLDYDRYVIHAGDVGATIGRHLATVDAGHALGAHLLHLWSFPSGDPEEMEKLGPEDFEKLEELKAFDAEWSGYQHLQNRRPGTLAYALADSPVAQLAWIADFAETFGDNPGAYADDGLLTTASLYWLTDTGGAAAQFYYEENHDTSGAPTQVCEAPIGVLVFPHDGRAIRPLAERDNTNIVQWTESPTGGHFGALFEPELVVREVRAFTEKVR